jgi:hypothetical protein
MLRRFALCGPIPQNLCRRIIHRKKALDAQFLQSDILGRAQSGDGGEEAERCVAFTKMHREHGARVGALGAGFGAANRRFLANPRIRFAFNWSMAGLLVISLIPVFW